MPAQRTGFEHQWSFSGTCARHALRHSLLCLSIAPSEAELTRAIGRSRLRMGVFGTDEESLKRGIRAFDCEMIEIAHASPRKARTKIDSCIEHGWPVIVCADKWDHWAVLCGRAKREYIWIDSDKRALVGASPWKKLRPWLECEGEEKPFYALAVRPPADRLRHSLVPRMHRARGALEDRALRSRWGAYLHAVRRVFGGGGVAAASFFEDHGAEILEAGKAGKAGTRGRPSLSRRLKWLGQVAALHEMGLARSQVEKAKSELLRQLITLP